MSRAQLRVAWVALHNFIQGMMTVLLVRAWRPKQLLMTNGGM